MAAPKKKIDTAKNLKPFKKDDPRINRKGRPKQLPLLKKLMDEVAGADPESPITDSVMAKVIKQLIATASKPGPMQVQAAKELLDRGFGKAKMHVMLEDADKRKEVSELFPFKSKPKKK